VETLLLTRSEVERLLEPAALLPALGRSFIAYSSEASARAYHVRATVRGPGSAAVLFPGVAPGVPAYTVKVHAKFPAEPQAIRGVLYLHDARTGGLLAVMDSTHLTAVRTGLSGALAAHVLARPDADVAAVVGAGVQGTHLLRSLAALRPLQRVQVYDARPGRAAAFGRAMTDELGVPVGDAGSVEAALAGAGVVLAATWAREPFIRLGMPEPGAHVTTLGADAVDAELGEVLGGAHPGRTSPGQVTVYGSVGLAFQDVVAAWAVYEAAQTTGVGRGIDFLA
jgi:ornithine cyclodeaminase